MSPTRISLDRRDVAGDSRTMERVRFLRAGLVTPFSGEIDAEARTWCIPACCTKNGKSHIVHLSEPAWAVVSEHLRGKYIFPTSAGHYFQAYSQSKRLLDGFSGIRGWRLHDLRRTIVSGMARMGIPPHVADKILNHQSGTISGVAAVYQRHEFLVERKDALDRWGAHVAELVRQFPA